MFYKIVLALIIAVFGVQLFVAKAAYRDSYIGGYNSIDASTAAGADMCAKISAAATSLHSVNVNGGVVDARGFSGIQTCAGSMFASWPGNGITVLTGAVTIETSVPQYVPAYTTWKGMLTSQSTNSYGTIVEPLHGSFTTVTLTVNASACSGSTMNFASTATLTGKPLGGIGYAIIDTTTGSKVPNNQIVANTTSTTVTTTGTVTCSNGDSIVFSPPVVGLGDVTGDIYYSRVEHVSATCVDSGGSTVPTGCMAFQNIQAEEGSYFHDTYAGIAQVQYDIEGLGGSVSPSGPQNSGPYIAILAQKPTNLVTLSTFRCLKLGNGVYTMQLGQAIMDVSCDGGTSSTLSGVATIDSSDVTIIGSHFEEAADAILIGSLRTTHNIVLVNMTCATGVTNTCVRLSSTAGSDSVSITGISDAVSTSILQDDQTNGCTIYGSANGNNPGLGSIYAGVQYWRGGNNVIWSPDSGCQSTRTISAAVSGAGTTQAGATLMTTDDVYQITTCGSSAGVTLPAGLAGSIKQIANQVSGNSCKLYPLNGSGGKINALATGTAFTLAASTSYTCFATSATQWWCK